MTKVFVSGCFMFCTAGIFVSYPSGVRILSKRFKQYAQVRDEKLDRNGKQNDAEHLLANVNDTRAQKFFNAAGKLEH